nr:MAG TPA: hypothetical protein [Crassvirales sp.]
MSSCIVKEDLYLYRYFLLLTLIQEALVEGEDFQAVL